MTCLMSKWRLVAGFVMVLSLGAITLVACGTEDAEPAVAPTTAAVVQPTTPPAAPTAVPATPTPALPDIAMPMIPAGASLHDLQEINTPGRMRSQGAPWRDGGGNRQYSMGVFGTLFQYSPDPPHTELVPWIATAWSANDDFTVYTVKLRDDAVWQDGTPITAAQVKAYWENGAKPENIAGWGAASLALGTIKEWEALKAGDVTDVLGLQALDDHTLEITMEYSWPPWPLYMAVWMTGLSKIDQVLAEPDSWWYDPIGAGPYDATYDPDSGLTVSTRVGLKGKHWWGEESVVDKLIMPAVADRQVQVIMFENQEMDIIGLDSATYTQAVEDANHPFNKLLHTALYPGLKWWGTMIHLEPMNDLNLRRGLAYGMDMETIIQAVLGGPWHAATGFFAPGTACHNSEDRGQYYDPDLARQYVAESTYGGGTVPVLKTDLGSAEDISVAVAVKEYWKDNLNIELDIFKRESGMPRRPESQLKRFSEAMWVPHETQIVKTFTATDIGVLPSEELAGATEYTELAALENFARGLALDDPEACTAWQAVQEHYTQRVYMIPWNWLYGPNWAIQPWIQGFESGPNIDTPLWQMWVEKH